ncbi:MAG TPA: thermonuclease family protein [Candidatus Limnocylindrales bacterium]|nr:thermonuclease family protein [Candidatus Limnocylindrales bacterium]
MFLRKLPGFRTANPWKMFVGGVFYGLIMIVCLIALLMGAVWLLFIFLGLIGLVFGFFGLVISLFRRKPSRFFAAMIAVAIALFFVSSALLPPSEEVASNNIPLQENMYENYVVPEDAIDLPETIEPELPQTEEEPARDDPTPVVTEERTPTAEEPIASITIAEASITRVVDGDTVVASFRGQSERLRFIGVDSPETDQPFGYEATAFTTRNLLRQQVWLEFDVTERDRFDRLLAYIWLEPPLSDSEQEVRSKMFNARLLLEGYAQMMTIPPNVKYADMFYQFQREGRNQGKGLWSD